MAQKDHELNILWWNVQAGRTNRLLRSPGEELGPLDLELGQFVTNGTAGLLCFGEFTRDSISSAILKELNEQFPYPSDHFFAYSEDCSELGIGVFSKYPLKIKTQATLEYFPVDAPPKKADAYRSEWKELNADERLFRKPFLHLSLEEPLPLDLFPVHLVMPWGPAHKKYSSAPNEIRKIGMELVQGGDNPLHNQIGHLMKFVEPILKDSDGKDSLLLGDFNVPTHIAGFPTWAYRKFSKYWKDALKGEEGFTWPTPFSNESHGFPNRLRIDHVFTRKPKTVLEAKILPLGGSDHYPVFVKLGL